MKRVLAILLCLLLSLGMLALVACKDGNGDDSTGSGNNNQSSHVHTYKTDAEWSKDASGHWYDVTCGCVDATLRKLQHVDDNKDAICDVCKFEYDHEHTYAEGWTADCTNHWNTADCGCIIAPANLGAHADANGDGECDTCKYVIEDLHTHYYDTKWTTDGEYHWHAALCEHGAEVADKAAHEINDAGYCTVCGNKIREIDVTNVGAILAAAVAHNYKVTSGNVVANEHFYEGTAVSSGKTDKVYFILGNEDAFVRWTSHDKAGNFIGVDDYWYETVGEDNVFGIQIPYYHPNFSTQRNEQLEMFPVSGSVVKLNGYTYIPGAILAAGYDDNSTLAQTLANLYDIMALNVNVNESVSSYDEETGKYTFSYNFFFVNETQGNTSQDGSGEDITSYAVEYFTVDVEFTVNEDFVINYAAFTVKTYRNLTAVDEDLTYDPETNTVTLLPSADPTIYDYVVSQTSGERTFETIYPKASLMPVDFELSYVTGTDSSNGPTVITSEELIVDADGDGVFELTLTVGEFARLHIGDVIPSSALASALDLNDLQWSFVNKDSSKGGKLWDETDPIIGPSHSSYLNCLQFKVIDPGEYTLTIDFGTVHKVIDITVPGEQPLYVPEDTADTKYVVTTDINAWADEYTFTAPESGTYTFTIPANLGFIVSGASTPVTDPFDPEYVASEATYSVDLAAGQTLTFNVGATEKAVFAIGVAFVAGEVEIPEPEVPTLPQTALIPNGANSVSLSNKAFTFTADANGKLTLKYGGFVMPGAGDYMVYQVNGGTAVTMEGGNVPYEIDLVAGDTVLVTVITSGYATIMSTWVAESSTGSGTDADPFILPEAGDYVCAFPQGQSDVVWYKLDIAQGGYVTLTTTYGNNAWFKLGTDTMFYSQDNQGNGESVSAYFPAGSVAYIGVGEYSEKKADISFTVEYEQKLSDDFSALVGTWYAQSEGLFPATYTLTINADGTGTLTYVAFGETNATVSYVFVDGTNVIIGYTSMSTSGTLLCTYDGTTFACTQGAVMMDSFTFQTTPIEDGGDIGGEDPDEPQEPETDPLKDAILGEYADILDGYTVFIYNSFDDGYIANIYQINDDGEYVVDLYFQFDMEDNGDGSYTLALTYFPVGYENGTENIDAILASNIVVTPVAKSIEELLTSTDFEGALNGESVMFYTDYETGLFIANFWPADYSYDYYYIATIVDNQDGTYTITFEADENNWTYNPDADYFHADKTIIATADGASVSIAYEGEGPVADVEGTQENPFVIEEAGDYVAPYAGGYEYPYYQFTAPMDGYATISSTYANLNVQYGTNVYVPYNNQNQDGTYANTVTVYLKAGQTVYFTVADNTFPEECDGIPFTASFEPFTSESASHLEGTWTGTETSMFGSTSYSFVINADGTGTGTGDMGYWQDEYEITFILVNGNAVTLYTVTTNGGTEYIFKLTYNEEEGTLSNATLTLTKTEDEPEVPAGPTPDYNAVITEGKNSVWLSADEVSANVAQRVISITRDGKYKIASGTLFAGAVIDAQGNTITKNDDYTYDLVVGEYTVMFMNLSMFGARADVAIELNLTWQAELEVVDPDEPDVGGDTTGADGEYLATHSSGRKYKVVIDSTAGTITITRSDMTGNFTGGATTVTANYSFDGTTVTYDGTYAMEFDGEGAPTKLTWGTQTVTEFVKQ